jgi:hypothetical protein
MPNNYIQIKLLPTQIFMIKQIGTRGSNKLNAWVKTYKISYSIPTAPNTYKFIQENGSAKTFTGNVDNDSEVLNDLDLLLSGIRIYPLTVQTKIALRIGKLKQKIKIKILNK